MISSIRFLTIVSLSAMTLACSIGALPGPIDVGASADGAGTMAMDLGSNGDRANAGGAGGTDTWSGSGGTGGVDSAIGGTGGKDAPLNLGGTSGTGAAPAGGAGVRDSGAGGGGSDVPLGGADGSGAEMGPDLGPGGLANGSACDNGSQCLSGFCVGTPGQCCAQACNSTCYQANRCAAGSCEPAPGTITCGSHDSLCGLVVNDGSASQQWSMQNNLQIGGQTLATDQANFTTVPSVVAGSPWIRPSGLSRLATADPLVTFSIEAPAEVYVGLDARMVPPAWMSGWADANATLAYSNTTGAGTASVTLKLYHATFPAGNVMLEPLGCASSDPACTMYIPVVKFVDQPSGGTGLACLKEPTACNPSITSSGGLPCHGGVCTVGSYTGPTSIGADSNGSRICLGSDSLCANGSTASLNPGWGAAFSVQLGMEAALPSVQLSSSGMAFELTSIPAQGLRAQVGVGTVWYCATVNSATQTIPWTSFNTRCWDNQGTSLSGPPSAFALGFVVPAKGSSATFDFCVKSLSF